VTPVRKLMSHAIIWGGESTFRVLVKFAPSLGVFFLPLSLRLKDVPHQTDG
jgi:hypothetical protein